MNWGSIIPNLVGGAITAGTAATLYYVGRRFERTAKAAEQRKNKALRALGAIEKFAVTVQEIVNLDRDLTKQFADASREAGGYTEPSQIVGRFIRPARPVERVRIEEVAFLFPEDADIYQLVSSIQQNQEFNAFRIKTYNEERRELEMILLNNPIDRSQSSGASASEEAKRQDFQFEHRIGFLNVVLVDLVQSLDQDKADAVPALDALVEAARKEFGDDLVIREIGLRERQNASS